MRKVSTLYWCAALVIPISAVAQDARSGVEVVARIVDNAGQPISRAVISIDGNSVALGADSLGEFRVDRLSRTRHSVVIQSQGFEARWFEIDLSGFAEASTDLGTISLTPWPSGNFSLSGTVVDSATGRPLAGAIVSVYGSEVARADSRGAFKVANVGRGLVPVAVQLIGYAPTAVLIEVPDASDVVGITVGLGRLFVTLQDIDVLAEDGVYHKRLARFNFYHRRRFSFNGKFFTAKDIEERQPTFVSDLLQGIPGIRVQPNARVGRLVLGRFDCPVRVFMNGLPINDIPSLDRIVRPASVAGLEVYVGGAGVPVRFDTGFGEDCGVVVIWTK